MVFPFYLDSSLHHHAYGWVLDVHLLTALPYVLSARFKHHFIELSLIQPVIYSHSLTREPYIKCKSDDFPPKLETS